jgi:hypothetical protein
MQIGDEITVQLSGALPRRAVIVGEITRRNCWRCRYLAPAQHGGPQRKHGKTLHTISKAACFALNDVTGGY